MVWLLVIMLIWIGKCFNVNALAYASNELKNDKELF